MNSVFSEQILADKLSKLNSTQQCIETLSHWCIFHRSKAELVITTWDKQFHSSDMAQKVPLLYLANDILQNSKRKGNEFVNEFWKVLPAALKDVSDNGDDNGKKVVSRLVNIWEDRRVFGSQRSLKDVMLGAELPPPLELSKKRPRSVRILKRDSRSIKTKLSIGGAAEKIVSAFHLVFTEHPIEDAEMSKCKSAVNRVRKMEKDVDAAYANVKDPNRKTLAKEIEEDENLLQQCIEKLKSVEANRLVLVDQLKEALHDQESEIENIRTQMQVAQAQIEEASIMRKRLNDENYVGVSKLSNVTASTNTNAKEGHGTKRTAAALAAEVADKLTASSSSQLIMSSVLSTFAAEEAKNAGLAKSTAASNSFTSMSSNSVSDSMSKSEKQMQVSNSNVFMIAQPQPAPLNHQYQSVLVNQPTMQSQAQVSQAQYHMTANNPSSQQYVQQSGAVLNPYGYGSIPPLPAGPPPQHPQSHLVTPMVPSAQQPLQMGHQQPMALAQQQPPVAPSFRPLQPPSLVYYAHPH